MYNLTGEETRCKAVTGASHAARLIQNYLIQKRPINQSLLKEAAFWKENECKDITKWPKHTMNINFNCSQFLKEC